MNRRRFPGLGVGAAAATGAASVPGAGTAAAESADGPFDERWGEAIDRAFEYVTRAMDAYQQGGALRIIQSYSDGPRHGNHPVLSEALPGTAFIYDTSLAIIAFLGRRRHDDLQRAMVLGDSLLYAQAHDPVYSDGRLRSAYWVGPFVLPDARNDSYFVRPDGTVNLVGAPWFILGGSTGEMACAGIALAHLFAHTGEHRYLDGAVRLGRWIVDSAFDRTGLGGGPSWPSTYLALLDSRYAAGLDWGKTNMATTDTPLSPNSTLKGNLRFGAWPTRTWADARPNRRLPPTRPRIPTPSGSPGMRSWRPRCARADTTSPISRPSTVNPRRRASI